MNKEWIETKKAKCAADAKVKRAEVIEKINNANFLSEKNKEILIGSIDKAKEDEYFYTADLVLDFIVKSDDDDMSFLDFEKFVRSLGIESYVCLNRKATTDWLNRYLDSDPMEFDGDIIITDPCYIIRSEHHGTSPLTDDDWGACGYGANMEVLGIEHYMTRDTIYGDWGCTVYDTDTNQPIGEFCADAGLVSVFLLDEVLKYNPDFDYHKERTWTTTLIPDFKGTVQFVVKHTEGVYEEDSEYRKAGERWEEFSVHVVGHGVDKKTGKPINFFSTQSSL